jgi:putative nucleotidyltransferase with HDIG domain
MGWLGLSLIVNGSIYTVDYSVLSSLLLNVFLTLMAFPLIPLLERVFGFTSAVSLLELSDMHRPLLKRLALEAPGTLQHSIQVANLCEAVADEIGADELLVKTAALYHDIGKIPKSEYYIENQGGKNPHEDLGELESAEIIISHISEGLIMAKKAGLPLIIRRFIATHHGTTRVEYFYRNYVKKHPNVVVQEEKFRYPGPKPVSKEETILMLADSMEASCKSLKNPTGEDIDKMVEYIIKLKMETQQLTESEMTFEEMDKARMVFKKLLRSMNHVRVEYPEE